MPDTIAAIATIPAPSAIGIVRLPGPDTRRILDGVFAPANGRPMSAQTPRKLVFGRALARSGGVIDEALAVLFPGPNSYTGEDCAEIHCHGSPVVLDEVLAAAFARGARQARGGEFTQRAFLSGRMDLIQAESVAALIDAESAGAARNAVGQLQGRMSRSVGGIYDALMDVVSRFYAIVDYPDEEIEPLQQAQIEQTLAESAERLDALLATFSRGRLLKSGVPAVILGKPNAGKSSLLNALLGYDRAIVTDIAGTTRDTVEEKVLVGSVLLRLCDTAGIRDAADTVERLGVERAQQAAQRAELALLVLDGSLSRENADLDDAFRADGARVDELGPDRCLVGGYMADLCPLPESAGPMVAASSSEPGSVPIKRIHSGNHTSRTNGKSRIFFRAVLCIPRSPPPAPLPSGLLRRSALADPVPGTSC